MGELLQFRPRNLNRPFYKDIEHQVSDKLDTAEHELRHAIPILVFGKHFKRVHVQPTTGATVHYDNLSYEQMQIVAMGSDGLSGNGSDQFKALRMEEVTHRSSRAAASIADRMNGRYGDEVIGIAAVYLSSKESATESDIRQFISWAQEDVAFPVFEANAQDELQPAA